MTETSEKNAGHGPGKDPRKAPVKRSAKPSSATATALSTPRFARLEIDSHRSLANAQAEIAKRINANSGWGAMLMINPVLAFKDLGVNVSARMADHILRSIQYRAPLRARRAALENSLAQTLGETPRPNDRKWLANVLFKRLELPPLACGEHEPVYLPTLADAAIRTAASLRPATPPRPRYPEARRFAARNRVAVTPWHATVRYLDLDAPLPALHEASSAPHEVAVEQLYFYKDSHPTVRDLLELVMLQHQGFAFQKPDAYRKIRDGVKHNAFRAWITGVQFKTSGEDA
ncbi:hypothetical protein [Paraburkholderia sp. XV]|uniref:hypothetical protein n=1 Tax=Paraburkholderia sp. XV TaxID=2831520 RepID=UPI001CD4A331|nr:hypothetical protein [Paraburkholderia sp. XV]